MKFDIGARIRQLRLEKSMTQEQLAQELGLTPQAVSKWENGVGLPDTQLLPELSVQLGVSIDALFSLTDEARFRRISRMLEDVRFLPDRDFVSAERWLEEKREQSETHAQATLLLAALYNKRADEYHQLAAPLAREALRLNPTEQDAHRAVFNAEKGVYQDWNWANHHELIDFYKGVVEAHPEDWHNYMWLLDLLVADRRVEEARAYVERLRSVWDNWRCELYMGEICLAACDMPGALEWFRRMTEREPDNWNVWAMYAEEMAKQGRYDEALTLHEKSFAMRKPPRYVDCDETVAGIQEIKGDYAAAIDTHRRIIDILREDWHITEGEAVDAHLRQIARLKARMNPSNSQFVHSLPDKNLL